MSTSVQAFRCMVGIIGKPYYLFVKRRCSRSIVRYSEFKSSFVIKFKSSFVIKFNVIKFKSSLVIKFKSLFFIKLKSFSVKKLDRRKNSLQCHSLIALCMAMFLLFIRLDCRQ